MESVLSLARGRFKCCNKAGEVCSCTIFNCLRSSCRFRGRTTKVMQMLDPSTIAVARSICWPTLQIKQRSVLSKLPVWLKRQTFTWLLATCCVLATSQWYDCFLPPIQNFDRQDFAVDTFNNTLNMLLRIGRFQSAIILLRRMIALFTKLQQEHNMFGFSSALIQFQVLSVDCHHLPRCRRSPSGTAGVQSASPVVIFVPSEVELIPICAPLRLHWKRI